MTSIVLAAENALEVISKRVGQLLRGSGVGAVRVEQGSDLVFPIPFGDRKVEKGGVAVTLGSPVFLCALEVELFIFGKELVVLVSEVVLEVKVLLVGRFGLLLQKLVLYGS